MTFESPAGVTTVQPFESVLTDNKVRSSSVSKLERGVSTAARATDSRRLTRRAMARDNEKRRLGYDGCEAERESDIEHSGQGWGRPRVLNQQLGGPLLAGSGSAGSYQRLRVRENQRSGEII